MRCGRGLAAALAIAGALTVAPSVPAPASAAALEVRAQAGAPPVQLASQSPWVGPEGEFVLRFTVAGDEGIPPPPTTVAGDPDLAGGPIVTVTVHERITSRSAFDLTLEGGPLGGVVARTEAPLGLLGVDPAGARLVRFGLSASAGDPNRVALTRAGVYPVRLQVRDAEGEPVGALVTHIVRVPEPDPDLVPLKLAVVVPLHAEPGLHPDGGRDLLARDRRRLGAITSALATGAPVPLTLAPTPETLVSAAAVDAGVVDRLRTRLDTDEVLGAPYVRVDPGSLLGAGLADELGRQTQLGSDTLTELLGDQPDQRTWLLETPLSTPALGALRERGVDRFLVPEDALVTLPLRVTLAQPFELIDRRGRVARAAVPDPALRDHLVGGPDPVLAAHHLLADLSVLFFDQPALERGVIVRTPFDWDPDVRTVESALSGLRNHPLIDPVTLDEWFDDLPLLGGDDPVEREMLEVDATVPVSFERLEGLRARTESFGSMLADPVRERLLVDELLLVAQAAGLSESDRQRLLSAAGSLLDDQLGRIEVPDRRTVTLTARVGEIPVTIRNDTGAPLRVTITLDSDKLTFPGGGQRSVDLAEGNTTTRFTVEARTSGAFPMKVTVASPDGNTLLGESRYTIRSTAVSGVGLVLTGGAGAFLVVWWGLHLRRSRRDKTSPV